MSTYSFWSVVIRRRNIVAAVASACLSLVAFPVLAEASTDAEPAAISVEASGAEGNFSSVDIAFDGLDAAEVKDVKAQLTAGLESTPAEGVAPANGVLLYSPPPPEGGSYQKVKCGTGHVFADANGIFTYQHACGGSTAPWGFRLSPYYQKVAVSPVTETGMAWTLMGVNKPRNAHHTVPASYLFHGTFNPVRDGSRITYSDDMYFDVVVSGMVGHAHAHIHGAIENVR